MDAFIDWEKCKRGSWCTFSELDLDHEHFDEMEGVYVIWQGEENPVALRVGQGYIKDCLVKEQNNIEMWTAKQRSEIYVTWGEVNREFCNGVVRYIAEVVQAELSSPHQDVDPVEVNLPSPWYKDKLPWE